MLKIEPDEVDAVGNGAGNQRVVESDGNAERTVAGGEITAEGFEWITCCV